MERLAEITLEQAFELKGELFDSSRYFNPIKINGRWYISEVEVIQCTTKAWVNELEIIEVQVPNED